MITFNRGKTLWAITTAGLASLIIYACKPGVSENGLDGFSVDELNSHKCGDIECKDVAPKYELLLKNIDPSKPNSLDHNTIRIGLFISHDKDAIGRPAGFRSSDLAQNMGAPPPDFDPMLRGNECRINDNNDLGVRSALKMFNYLTGACAPDLDSLLTNFNSHTAGPEKLENQKNDRTHFLKNPSWKNEVKGTATTMTIWGKGPTLAKSLEGVTHFSSQGEDSGSVARRSLETHNYIFDIIVDNAGSAIGEAFGRHLVDPNTSMSFFWGHFYPADAQAAAADQKNTVNGGQAVRTYFRDRTREIYGPMLKAISSQLATSKKPYLLGFLVGCFSEQLEDALITAVNQGNPSTLFDWVGQRGRHNYLEFHNSLHRVLLAMHFGASFAHYEKNENHGILNSFVFADSGLENRFSAENPSIRTFYNREVPNKVIPVLRSNRNKTLLDATGKGKAGFSYDGEGNVITIDQNGDASRN